MKEGPGFFNRSTSESIDATSLTMHDQCRPIFFFSLTKQAGKRHGRSHTAWAGSYRRPGTSILPFFWSSGSFGKQGHPRIRCWQFRQPAGAEPWPTCLVKPNLRPKKRTNNQVVLVGRDVAGGQHTCYELPTFQDRGVWRKSAGPVAVRAPAGHLRVVCGWSCSRSWLPKRETEPAACALFHCNPPPS
jgi:hypothetical protein